MGEQVFSEPTQPLLYSSRPHGSIDPEFSDSSDVVLDQAIADQSTRFRKMTTGVAQASMDGVSLPELF